MHYRIASLPAAVIAGLSLFAGSASAISFGVGPIGGLNLTNISGEAGGEDLKSDMRTLFAVGARAEFGVTTPFSLLVEPQFLKRGWSADAMDDLGNTAKLDASMNYIELPVLAKAKFGSMKAHGYVFAGPSLGIFLNGSGEIDGKDAGDMDNVSTLNIAGDIGVGGSYQLQEFVYLNADVRYAFGFTNMVDKQVDDETMKSRDIQIMVGVLFHLLK